SVAEGDFQMGRPYVWDSDWGPERTNELPVHTVTLSAYRLGKYEVTSQQYADVLNWAIHPDRGYLRTSGNTVWTGTGDIYAGGNLQLALSITASGCNLQFSGGVFSPKTRPRLPGVNVSMGDHPVLMVSWYGAVMF